jgi:hypothetical protein
VIALVTAPQTSGRYYVPVAREDKGSEKARHMGLAESWMLQTDALLEEKGYTYSHKI